MHCQLHPIVNFILKQSSITSHVCVCVCLTRVHDRPGRTQQTRIFCGKTLFLHLQEQECKSKSSIAYIFRSQRARARAREQESKREKKNKNKKARERTRKQEREWQNPVPFKENYPPPRTYYSLIGCSPSAQLSS